ncbi:hypothetical protein C8J56DRAFT_978612 [Mycena floridula]|nr:hypothetical protein C8J56DRAFT_978612 [Mycena floridula]
MDRHTDSVLNACPPNESRSKAADDSDSHPERPHSRLRLDHDQHDDLNSRQHHPVIDPALEENKPASFPSFSSLDRSLDRSLERSHSPRFQPYPRYHPRTSHSPPPAKPVFYDPRPPYYYPSPPPMLQEYPHIYAGPGIPRFEPSRYQNDGHHAQNEPTHTQNEAGRYTNDGAMRYPTERYDVASRYTAPNEQGYHPAIPTSGNVVYTDDATTKLSDRVRRRCFNCSTTDTSTWRRSNLNVGKVLCNKCGLFERTHARSRPEKFAQKKEVIMPNQLPPLPPKSKKMSRDSSLNSSLTLDTTQRTNNQHLSLDSPASHFRLDSPSSHLRMGEPHLRLDSPEHHLNPIDQHLGNIDHHLPSHSHIWQSDEKQQWQGEDKREQEPKRDWEENKRERENWDQGSKREPWTSSENKRQPWEQREPWSPGAGFRAPSSGGRISPFRPLSPRRKSPKQDDGRDKERTREPSLDREAAPLDVALKAAGVIGRSPKSKDGGD